jgi:hypothetical protein
MDMNPEEYNKLLSILNRQKESRKKYMQTEEGKQKLKEAKQRYYQKNKSELNKKRVENQRKKRRESILNIQAQE